MTHPSYAPYESRVSSPSPSLSLSLSLRRFCFFFSARHTGKIRTCAAVLPCAGNLAAPSSSTFLEFLMKAPKRTRFTSPHSQKLFFPAHFRRTLWFSGTFENSVPFPMPTAKTLDSCGNADAHGIPTVIANIASLRSFNVPEFTSRL